MAEPMSHHCLTKHRGRTLLRKMWSDQNERPSDWPQIYVLYNEVLLYRVSFSYTSHLLLGRRISFVTFMLRTLLGSLCRGSAQCSQAENWCRILSFNTWNSPHTLGKLNQAISNFDTQIPSGNFPLRKWGKNIVLTKWNGYETLVICFCQLFWTWPRTTFNTIHIILNLLTNRNIPLIYSVAICE